MRMWRLSHLNCTYKVSNRLAGRTLVYTNSSITFNIVYCSWIVRLSVTSPLNSNVLLEAGLAAGQAARATEQRKHDENDAKCKELGWIASPWWLRHIVLGGQK